MHKVFKVADIHELLRQVQAEEITFSRMVERMNEMVVVAMDKQSKAFKSNFKYTKTPYVMSILNALKKFEGIEVVVHKGAAVGISHEILRNLNGKPIDLYDGPTTHITLV